MIFCPSGLCLFDFVRMDKQHLGKFAGVLTKTPIKLKITAEGVKGEDIEEQQFVTLDSINK